MTFIADYFDVILGEERNRTKAATLSLLDLDDVTGSSGIGFQASPDAALPRTVADKLNDVVSVLDFMTAEEVSDVRSGSASIDVTAAIQAALDSGRTAIFIPAGSYLCGTLIMPNIKRAVIYGEGEASRLIMKAGGKLITWAGDAGAIYYAQGSLRDILIDGTNGTDHCIDTTGVGGLDLNNIYIHQLPIGFDGIYIDGMGAERTHDMRVNNYRCYSNQAGRAGISFGPMSADSSVSQFVMNGNIVTEYCARFEAGATAITMQDSHPYNAAVNVVWAGTANSLQFTNCTLDRSQQNIVELAGTSHVNFDNCYIEAVQSGKIGINCTASAQFITVVNTHFQGGTAQSALSADATTNAVRVFMSDAAGSTWTTTYNLLGASSVVRGSMGGGGNPLFVNFGFSGTATAAQAQATTRYLGVNSVQTNEINTYYVTPYAGRLKDIYIAVDNTPAAGQTFTFTARVNGVAVGTALVVNNGGFGGTISLNVAVSEHDRVSVESVFSATSGSASARWTARFEG